MTDLERRALLGDAEAQRECTEKGVLLPCPFCGGDSRIVKRKFKTGFYPSGGTYYVHCARCLITTQPRRQKNKVIEQWNTRPAPPIGRCGECAAHVDNKCANDGYYKLDTGFCSDFVSKGGEEK